MSRRQTATPPQFQAAFDQLKWDFHRPDPSVESQVPSSLEWMLVTLKAEAAVWNDTNVPCMHLQMSQSLMNEIQRAGPCTELFLTGSMLEELVKWALLDEVGVSGFPELLLSWTWDLLEVYDPSFCSQSRIHGPLLLLLRGCRHGLPMVDTLNMHVLLASKIRQLPHLLPLFFHYSPHSQEDYQESFSLFDKLMEYIHLDSRGGHLARTACLDILQVVTPDFQEYILNCRIPSKIISILEGFFVEISSPNGSATKPDHDSFVSVLKFLETFLGTCMPCPSLISSALEEFKLFLHRNFLSKLNKASDFDGSSEQCLRQLLFLIGTISHPLLAELVSFVLLKEEFESDSDGEFAMQYILLSKMDSCAPSMVVVSLQIIASLLCPLFVRYSLSEICPKEAFAATHPHAPQTNHQTQSLDLDQDSQYFPFLSKLIVHLERFFQNNWKVNLAVTACWTNLVSVSTSVLGIRKGGESVNDLLARLKVDMETRLDVIPNWELEMEAYAQDLDAVYQSSSSDPKTALFIKNALIYSEFLQELSGILAAPSIS